MARTRQEWNREDRDLLVELRTEMRSIFDVVNKIKDEMINRIAIVETNKADKTDLHALRTLIEETLKDHEKRLRITERSIWVYVGAATVIATVGSLLLQYLIPKILNG